MPVICPNPPLSFTGFRDRGIHPAKAVHILHIWKAKSPQNVRWPFNSILFSDKNNIYSANKQIPDRQTWCVLHPLYIK